VHLKEEHPDAFEEAKRYEKIAREHQSPFTWSSSESLEELERPERVSEIKARHAQRVARIRAARRIGPLQLPGTEGELMDDEGAASGCLVCHK
jgi:hypothetical protein